MKKSLGILIFLLSAITWSCKDDVSPVIVLEGDKDMKLVLNKPYVEPGFSAFDDKDGEITESVEVTSIDVNMAGEQTITYRVTDAEGNEGLATRQVTVFNEISDLAGTWSGEYVSPYPGINKKTYAEVIELSTTVNKGIVFKNFGGNAGANVVATIAGMSLNTSLSFGTQTVAGGNLTVESAVLENRNRITLEYTIGSAKGVLVLIKN